MTTALVYDEENSFCLKLGWCPCGAPDEMDSLILALMRGIRDRVDGGWDGATQWPFGLPEDVAIVLSYVLDQKGWIEHLRTIQDAHLTEDGASILAYFEDCLPPAVNFTVREVSEGEMFKRLGMPGQE